MKIHWNSVTWYSKTIALILFVGLPFLGFYLGQRYEAVRSAGTIAINNGTTSTLLEYYINPAEWQKYETTNGDFSIAAPLNFIANQNPVSETTTEWSMDSEDISGNVDLTFIIPATFDPQSNLVEARLSVGSSKNDKAVRSCLTPSSAVGGGTPITTVMIGDVQFTKFLFTGVGAGNIYETTSYRALHDGRCYAIEYTLHSAQIANYPAEDHIHPFDQIKLKSVLDRIVGTFRFL